MGRRILQKTRKYSAKKNLASIASKPIGVVNQSNLLANQMSITYAMQIVYKVNYCGTVEIKANY